MLEWVGKDFTGSADPLQAFFNVLGWMNKIEKIIRTICSYSIVPCAVALVSWVFVFAAYIISRLFGLGWLFVEEYTTYWLVFIAYIPLAYALMTEAHTRTDIVTSRLREKLRNILQLFTNFSGLVIVSYLLWRSIGWVLHGLKYDVHSGTDLNTVLWPIFTLISIGLALFTLMFMVKLGHSVTELMRARRARKS